MGKLTISMAMFNSYAELPEGSDGIIFSRDYAMTILGYLVGGKSHPLKKT